MPDLTRFAGYEVAGLPGADPSLSREDKISALRTWEGLLHRFHGLGAGDPPAEQNMLDEIERALAGLDHR